MQKKEKCLKTVKKIFKPVRLCAAHLRLSKYTTAVVGKNVLYIALIFSLLLVLTVILAFGQPSRSQFKNTRYRPG